MSNKKNVNNDTKNSKSSKKTKKKLSSKTKKIILNTFLCFVIFISLAVIALTISIMKTRENDDEVLDLNNLELSLTTILYYTDSKTGEVKELDRIYANENRIWVDFAHIPKHVSDAFIAIEDKRFYSHAGFDLIRTVGSAINLFIPIYKEESGGSTITQQLVKNLTDDWDKTWYRKITEIVRAYDLTKNYSKDKVLEAYLNTINLAGNNQGIRAAANSFFSKEVDQLSIAEAASLAAITKNPSRFNPYTKPEENKKRQELVLWNMFDQKLITKEQYDQAMSEKLVLNSKQIESSRKVKSWFVDQVIEDVIDTLMHEKKYSKEEATNKIYNGGLRIYTTIDPNIQNVMQETYDSQASKIFPKQKGDVQPESAMLIMEPNGQVKGIIGGMSKNANRILNRATQSVRQPGSTMKPIGTYTAAIDRDLITMSTIANDAPFKQEDNKPWPQNYYGSYKGNMPVAEALRRSVNTIPAKIVTDLGFDISFDYLKNKFKISTVYEKKTTASGEIKSDLNASALALGGMTEGIKPIELAAAYQVFANGGFYYKPHTFTKITTNVGKLVYDNKVEGERVLSEETSYIMNRMLYDVMNGPNGTGNFARFPNMPLIGKTGTTSDNKDLWFAGASAYYVGVTFWGFDEPKEMVFSPTTHPSMSMWKAVMQKVHNAMPSKNFPVSNNVITAEYCTVSGKLAGDGCTSKMIGYYKKSNVPAKCNVHSSGSQNDNESNNKKEEDKNNTNSLTSDSEKLYSIEFNSNGGSKVVSVNIRPGDSINIDSQKTTREGYKFLGWYDIVSDKKVSGIIKAPKGGIKLIAKWEKLE